MDTAQHPVEDHAPRPASASRCLLVWASAGAVVAGVLRLLAADLGAAADALGSGTLATTPIDVLLSWGAAAVVVVVVAWAWAVTGLVALDAARGRVRRVRGCPEPLRRLVLGACGAAVGIGLLGGLVGPAAADSPPPPVPLGAGPVGEQDTPAAGSLADGAAPRPGAGTTRRGLDGLPLPDRLPDLRRDPRPGLGAEPTPSPTPDEPPGPRWTQVRPGDSLWSIAEADLRRTGRPVDDAVVDARWRTLHRLNRAVVGADPDLVRPGQRLRLPTTPTSDPTDPTDPTGRRDRGPGAPRP